MKFQFFQPLRHLVGAFIMLGVTFGASHSAWATDGQTYQVTIDPDNFRDYQETTRDHDIYDPDNWKKMALNRMTLEMLILHVAPVMGGCGCEIELIPYSAYTPHIRSIEEVRSGKYITHSITVFENDERVREGLFLSEPVLRGEDFFVGLYTDSRREDVLKLGRKRDYEAIKALRFIAGNRWSIDNQVLEELGVDYVGADSYQTLLDMISQKRADVVMQPFQPGSDMAFEDGESDRRFIPVRNVKLRFPHGRRYFVSQVHHDGKAFLEALNRGITALNGDGTLYEMLVHAGVINEDTNDYHVLFDDEQISE